MTQLEKACARSRLRCGCTLISKELAAMKPTRKDIESAKAALRQRIINLDARKAEYQERLEALEKIA